MTDESVTRMVLRLREGLAARQPVGVILGDGELRVLLDAYEQAAGVVSLLQLTEAHTVESTHVGAHATMPQGHLLIGDGHRALVVLDNCGSVSLGGITITDPAVLDAAAEHLAMLAGRLRDRQAPSEPLFAGGFDPAAPVETTPAGGIS